LDGACAAVPLPKTYRRAVGAFWTKPAVVHNIRLHQSAVQLANKNPIPVDIVRRRILHCDIASEGLGHRFRLDPCSARAYKYPFGDVTVVRRYPVNQNVIHDLSCPFRGDEDFAGVGPLGRGEGGAVDVQISQVDVIDARIPGVTRNVDPVQVAACDLKIVDFPILLVEQRQSPFRTATIDHRLRARSVSIYHNGGVRGTGALRLQGSIADRAALEQKMIPWEERKSINAGGRVPRRGLRPIAVLLCRTIEVVGRRTSWRRS